MKRPLLIVGLLSLFVGSACDPKSALVKRPENPTADIAVTQLWNREILATARTGDWLVSRSYYLAGDAIVVATRGEEFSHAAILDRQRKTVVEAVGSGVRELSLEEFLQRNHAVAVIRPYEMTAAEQATAVTLARAQIGKSFDTLGMFGLNDPEAFYCSELVAWASNSAEHGNPELVITTPADLLKFGRVIYWSGNRSNEQTQAVALNSR